MSCCSKNVDNQVSNHAGVAELADALASGASGVYPREGSSPFARTITLTVQKYTTRISLLAESVFTRRLR